MYDKIHYKKKNPIVHIIQWHLEETHKGLFGVVLNLVLVVLKSCIWFKIQENIGGGGETKRFRDSYNYLLVFLLPRDVWTLLKSKVTL